MSGKSLSRQRGTVLVTVLMMFAIAAMLATEMAYRQKLDVRRTSAMLMTDQAREYLLGAEALAMLALKDDYKADKKANKYIDSLDEEWARKRQPFPVEGGFIQGEIIDAQSKFNINVLVDENGGTTSQKAKVGKILFIQLLNQLEIPEDGSPELVYQKVVDWIDADQDEIGPDGREDGAYLRGKRPYRAGNRLVLDISELRAIEGMDAKTFDKLSKYLVALPPNTPTNLNTLDTTLMGVMKLRNSQQLLAEREQGGIEESEKDGYIPDLSTLGVNGTPPNQNGGGESSSEIPNANPGNPQGNGNFDLKDLFTTQSNYFELLAKADVGGRLVYSKSLIYRYPDGHPSGKSGKLKVIYRAYIDPLQQPMTQPQAQGTTATQ